MAITGINMELCNGCAVCLDSCPCDVLRMNESGRAFIAYADDCQTCYLCQSDCPRGAITVDVALPYVPVPYKC